MGSDFYFITDAKTGKQVILNLSHISHIGEVAGQTEIVMADCMGTIITVAEPMAIFMKKFERALER